jgi:hypothetical protein
MMEKTEQWIAGATIGLAGAIVGSLAVGIALHTPGRAPGVNVGGGVKDTPIVMEGGSIVLDSDTTWTKDGLTRYTTLTPGLQVLRIVVKDLGGNDLPNQKPINATPNSKQTWEVDLTTAGGEIEKITGTNDDSGKAPITKIAVNATAGSQLVLSDNDTELTLFPAGGHQSNKVDKISVSVDGKEVPNSPVDCATGSGNDIQKYRCFVHFKTR